MNTPSTVDYLAGLTNPLTYSTTVELVYLYASVLV